MNTVHNTWYSKELRQHVCDSARRVSNTTAGDPIENTMIVAHSMGNLIVANALAEKECSLGTTSKWIGLQGPLAGTQSVNYLKQNCLSEHRDFHPSKGINKVLRWAGFCPVPEAYKSMSFENGNGTADELNQKYEQAQEMYRNRIDAAMCGVSSFGLWTVDAIVLNTASKLSPHMSEDDGVVEFNSCAGPLDQSKFSSDYRGNAFYRAEINHIDGSFENGDGFWGASRKPVKWFQCLYSSNEQLIDVE